MNTDIPDKSHLPDFMVMKSPQAKRLLIIGVTLLAFFPIHSALAIKGGQVVREPEGLRRSIVQIIGPGGSRCSGTVISPRLVLTAAHCFPDRPGQYRIRALDTELRFHYTISSQIIIHPDFDAEALGTDRAINDIALVRIDHNFPDWIRPLPLASGSLWASQLGEVLAAGFGMSRDNAPSSAGTLRQRRYDILPQGSNQNQFFLVEREGTPRNVRNNGVCRGDSGGPVLKQDKNGYSLIGVISAVMSEKGRDCGTITAVMAAEAYQKFIANNTTRTISRDTSVKN